MIQNKYSPAIEDRVFDKDANNDLDELEDLVNQLGIPNRIHSDTNPNHNLNVYKSNDNVENKYDYNVPGMNKLFIKIIINKYINYFKKENFFNFI